eukprot:TRINITY_DN75229_c0_g1_i1.p1 TRINITY_DN75229_c0_g1~~TRINITY_DN75229_c0_g1_i1.p1  ORF type:complete len:311 (+),score=96.19 TRINITY_DN75229_c0_g1_i1:133-933(+)
MELDMVLGSVLNETATMVPDPEVGEQFQMSAVVGGTITLAACVRWRLDWVSKGSRIPEGYSEVAPPWAYDASAKITFTWAPLVALWILYNVITHDHAADSVLGCAYDFLHRRELLDVMVHGGIFGLMVKDFFVCYDTPDVLMLAHHLIVMCLMAVIGTLPDVHFVRLSTIATLVTELGSACYCVYIVHRTPVLYFVGMNLSNVVMCVSAYSLFTVNFDRRPLLAYILTALAVGVVIGRQAVMLMHLKINGEFSTLAPASLIKMKSA